MYAHTISVLKTLFRAFEVLMLLGFESCVGPGAHSSPVLGHRLTCHLSSHENALPKLFSKAFPRVK